MRKSGDRVLKNIWWHVGKEGQLLFHILYSRNKHCAFTFHKCEQIYILWHTLNYLYLCKVLDV
jgi:hypothetical protein